MTGKLGGTQRIRQFSGRILAYMEEKGDPVKKKITAVKLDVNWKYLPRNKHKGERPDSSFSCKNTPNAQIHVISQTPFLFNKYLPS